MALQAKDCDLLEVSLEIRICVVTVEHTELQLELLYRKGLDIKAHSGYFACENY